MKKLFLTFLSLSCWLQVTAQQPLVFNNLESLLAFAETNSLTLRTGDENLAFARLSSLAAKANTLNLRGTGTWNATDNFKLPVNFIPAEAFGGPAGSFREITLGQQFVNAISITPQIDILNPSAWARVQSAKTNLELTTVNNLLIRRSLSESVAACYYNILSLQEQEIIAASNAAGADSLLQLFTRRFEAGLLRQQDVNNAQVNLLNVKDALAQIRVRLEQQYNSLRILCDLAPGSPVEIREAPEKINGAFLKLTVSSDLLEKQSSLLEQFQQSELRANRMAYMPTLSLTGNFNWQQNSNNGFFDNDARWISSQFIGLRLSVPLPPDVNRWSATQLSKINTIVAGLNARHAALQEDLNLAQLELDHEKAFNTWRTADEIAMLKEANYRASKQNFAEGILPPDQLLIAFTDWLSSRLQAASAWQAAAYSRSRINIYNTVQ